MNLPCCFLGSALLSVLPISAVAALELPYFTDFQRSSNNEVELRVSSSNGSFYRLETSTNLVDWEGWITGLGTGNDSHTDVAAPYWPIRYYRSTALTGTGYLTGDHLTTTNGDVIFHPINHASLVLSWNGLTIYNDPVGGSTPYTGLARANLILVSHSHSDHYSSSTLSSVLGTGGKIVVPPSIYSGLSPTLQASAISLPNNVTTNVMDITIAAIPAYNSNHPLGSGNGYVITLGGKRIYFSGDTGDIPEMRALQDIDVSFLCMNVPFTMTVQQAASATREFQPRVVYPYHYRNQNGTYADLNLFKELVSTDLGIEVRIRDWY